MQLPTPATSGKQDRCQFTIAQLLAIAFGIGVVLAAGQVLSMIDDARPRDWIVVIAGFVAATIALFAAGMPRLGEMNNPLGARESPAATREEAQTSSWPTAAFGA